MIGIIILIPIISYYAIHITFALIQLIVMAIVIVTVIVIFIILHDIIHYTMIQYIV